MRSECVEKGNSIIYEHNTEIFKMSFLFGGAPKANKDPVKEHQKELRHALRALEREDIKAGAQEKTLVNTITKHAREQRMDICRTQAKELVRLRVHRSRLAIMKGHMTTLAQQLSTVQSCKIMQETMAKTTVLLQKLNHRMDARAIHRMLMEYEKQSTLFNDGQEVVEETLDTLFETENEQVATDDAVLAVFQELGLDLALGMSVPGTGMPVTENTDDLESRLRNLRTT